MGSIPGNIMEIVHSPALLYNGQLNRVIVQVTMLFGLDLWVSNGEQRAFAETVHSR